jgi:DNA replication protein DnaC
MCEMCAGTGLIRKDVPLGDPNFGRTEPCPCQAAELAERYHRLLEYPLRRATFEMLITQARPGTERMVAAAKIFSSDPQGWLTIWGRNGTGKSIVLRAITTACITAGTAALYVPLQIAVDWLKGGIEHPDFPVDKRAERLAGIPVLCLDEVTGAFWSSWVSTQIETILDRRYSYARPTVLAMDEDPEETLHPRLVSRMRESIFIHNEDSDYRRALGAARERTQP